MKKQISYSIIIFFSLFTLLSAGEAQVKLPGNFRKMVDRFSQRFKLNPQQKQKLEGQLKKQKQAFWDVYFQLKSGRITAKEANKIARQRLKKIFGSLGIAGVKGLKKGNKGKGGKKGKKNKNFINEKMLKKLLRFKNVQEEEEISNSIRWLVRLQQSHKQTIWEMRITLRLALRDSKAPKEMIDKMISTYGEIQQRARVETQGAKDELLKKLSPHQKAVLIAYGVL